MIKKMIKSFVKQILPISLAIALPIYSYSQTPSTSNMPAPKYDVSYGWGPNKDALERNKIKLTSSFDIKPEKLIIVKGKNNFGLIYNLNGSKEEAFALANSQREKGLEAIPIRDKGYSPISNQKESNKPSQVLIHKETLPQKEIQSDLEDRVESYIKKCRTERSIMPEERTAWSAYDFDSGKKILSVNEEIPLKVASMIKPYVALAYLTKVKQGKLTYNLEAKHQMEEMIQHSNNCSTNWLMKKVGGAKEVQSVLENNYSSIFHQTNIVELIPPGGRAYNNTSSLRDFSRFLYALWNDNLPESDEIRRLMNLPKRNRIYSGVSNIPIGTKVFDKTGSTSLFIGDGGIIYFNEEDGSRHAYTIIGGIQRSSPAGDYKGFMRRAGNVIRGVSGLTYSHINKK